MDPLACLRAAANLEKARAIMEDNFHLDVKARNILASKIKEQVVDWLRGRKSGFDGEVRGDHKKRPRLDSEVKKTCTPPCVGSRGRGGIPARGRGGGNGRDSNACTVRSSSNGKGHCGYRPAN